MSEPGRPIEAHFDKRLDDLRDHVDTRFEIVSEGMGRMSREFGHRMKEQREAESAEHAAVLAKLDEIGIRMVGHETRIDLLEAERDKQIGARVVADRLMSFAQGIFATVIAGVLVGYLTGLFG